MAHKMNGAMCTLIGTGPQSGVCIYELFDMSTNCETRVLRYNFIQNKFVVFDSL